jgi:hypothetical protein
MAPYCESRVQKCIGNLAATIRCAGHDGLAQQLARAGLALHTSRSLWVAHG